MCIALKHAADAEIKRLPLTVSLSSKNVAVEKIDVEHRGELILHAGSVGIGCCC